MEVENKIELTYEERVKWFINNYYETGMEYKILLETMKDKDLNNFKWYNDVISIPKYKVETEFGISYRMETRRDILKTFVERMQKIGIDVKLVGNYPWIYLDEINGKRVTETFEGNHGFTIAFLPIRMGQDMRFTDIKEIFKLIRKYTNGKSK